MHRLATLGANRLPVPRPKSPLAIVTGHLTSLPVLLLGGAAVLSITAGAAIEAGVIASVVAANATVGFVTERRVERIGWRRRSSATARPGVRVGNVVTAVLDRLIGVRPAPRCPRCGERTRLLSEDPVRTFPPLFQVVHHCEACGALVTRYRAVEGFE